MRILIAEDDQVMADGLLRTLRSSGAAVDHVASGTEADAALASALACGTRTQRDTITWAASRSKPSRSAVWASWWTTAAASASSSLHESHKA